MKNLNHDYIVKFKIEEYKLKEVGQWIISLRPEQVTIGSLVLTLNRHCPKLSEITSEESANLSIVFKEIEQILDATFQPDKINYLALMMIDQQVHFHVIPRFQDVIEFQGEEFRDLSWPGPPSLEKLELNNKTLNNIYSYLKKYV